MMDKTVVTEILREHMGELRQAGDRELLVAVVGEALRLISDAERNVLTEDEIGQMLSWFSARGDVACYLERRGLHQPEACIVFALRDGMLFLNDSLGQRLCMKMADYGTAWWLYRRFPGAEQRRGREVAP